MIEIKNVTKTIKDQVILNNISMSVKKGICVGLIGHNGSGKTMLLKAICGFTKINSGDIRIDNQPIIFSEKYIKNAGIIIEQPSFINYLTGFENLQALANIQKVISKEGILLALLHSTVMIKPNNNTLPGIGFFHL